MTTKAAQATDRYRKRHPDRVKASRSRGRDKEYARYRRRRADLSTWAVSALPNVRHRARKQGVAFDIAPADIQPPTHCPVLGIPLKAGAGTHVDNSPSVDRFDNDLGYVSGNVRVISYRANRLKCDATVDELRKVIAYMEGVL